MNATSSIARNRAEELGLDVWADFVVPPGYDRLDPFEQDVFKPRVFIGGRGSGKTMLLRYFSHHSRFSDDRPSIPDYEVRHIGLYWRFDTQFTRVMRGRGLPRETWEGAFGHMAALLLTSEVLASLKNIAKSKWERVGIEDLDAVPFERLTPFGLDLGSSFADAVQSVEAELFRLETWVGNVGKAEEPLFLPGKNYVGALVTFVKEHISGLVDVNFDIYLDEYENIQEYQQRFVNTWIKHSTPPLVFHLAVKRNAFVEKRTVGDESIAQIHDYRETDIEASFRTSDPQRKTEVRNTFELFAAEVLFLRLTGGEKVAEGIDLEAAVDPVLLRDTKRLNERRSVDYRSHVVGAAERLFPGLTEEQLGRGLLKERSLRNVIAKDIEKSLRYRGSSLDHALFFRDDHPRATTVVPALLKRSSLNPSDVLLELNKLEEGIANSFTGTTGWVQNNFVGCLLMYYADRAAPCPLYVGFSRFCVLASGNLRHLLELCYRSIEAARDADAEKSVTEVSVDIQARAVRLASASLLREVKTFGHRSHELHTFAHRLGELFRTAHSQPTQSETERSHFAVIRGDTLDDADVADLVTEAVKWSVLLEDRATKKKNEDDREFSEYQLNPVYAPFFTISYRKKRRIELSTSELKVLASGTVDDYKVLIRSYADRWNVEPERITPSLFEPARE